MNQLLLTGAALAALLVAEYRSSGGRLTFKTLASLGFVWMAVADGLPTTPVGWLLLTGLGLSLLGDVALVFKHGFLPGLVAFAATHLAYTGAFVNDTTNTVVMVSAAALAIVALVAVRRWLDGRVPERLNLPVQVYMIAISAMLVTAAGQPDRMLYAGAALFYLSDLAVARQRFVTPGFRNKLVGLPLYYAGQLLIASAVT